LSNPTDDDEAWVDDADAISKVAFRLALEQNFADAGKTLQGLGAKHGTAGLVRAMVDFCDVYMSYMFGDGPVWIPDPDAVLLVDASTGEAQRDLSTLQPAQAWVVRMVQARGMQDESRWWALCDEITTPGQAGEYIMTMLFMVTSTIRTLPEGAGNMGHVPS